MNSTENNTNNSGNDLVQVSWSGKHIFIEKSKLDEWYSQSFEEHEEYVKQHPWAVQQIPVHDFNRDMEKREAAAAKEEKPKEPLEMSNYVVVHWNNKSLLLPRDQLEIWYDDLGPEERMDYIKRHPSVEMHL